MTHHKVNRYVCTNSVCNGIMVTIDLHDGTTPFMLQCRTCNHAMAQSSFYKSSQFMDPSIAFIRPTTGPFSDSEHVRQGGLIPVDLRTPLTKIQIQKQPNAATCLVTSFAMVLNIPVAELMEQIGHDGLEILFPDLKPPYCYRGHHIQELIFACFERGYAVTPIEPIPVSSCGEQRYHHHDMVWWLEKTLLMRHGVLVGKIRAHEHSVAWDRVNCHDPATKMIYPIDRFELRTFYMIAPQSMPIFQWEHI